MLQEGMVLQVVVDNPVASAVEDKTVGILGTVAQSNGARRRADGQRFPKHSNRAQHRGLRRLSKDSKPGRLCHDSIPICWKGYGRQGCSLFAGMPRRSATER